MTFRRPALFLALAVLTTGAKAQDEPSTTKAEVLAPKPKTALATFGGGCFWCTEAVFERLPGVKSVVSGYSGGSVPNPTYEMVCAGLTGHAEVIQVAFDPSSVSYETIINLFFKSHDPTTLNSQGPDFGTQYRSVIFHHDEAQRLAARKAHKELTERKAFRRPIVTQLQPFKPFYPAEDYHQDYYRDHPNAPYSRAYIAPKLQKLKSK